MNLNRKTLHLHEVLLSVGEPASGRNSSFRTQTADCFDCQDPFKQTFAAFRTFIQSLAGAPCSTQKNTVILWKITKEILQNSKDF